MAQLEAALVERLYRQAEAERWQVPVDRFALALEASAAKAFAAPRRSSGQDLPSERDLERYLGSLRLEDLALACACAGRFAVCRPVRPAGERKRPPLVVPLFPWPEQPRDVAARGACAASGRS